MQALPPGIAKRRIGQVANGAADSRETSLSAMIKQNAARLASTNDSASAQLQEVRVFGWQA
jgi:hypothetical protein